MPSTIFTQNIQEIRRFFKAHKKVILKPIHSFGGNDIYLLKKFDLKFSNCSIFFKSSKDVKLILSLI